MKTTTTLASCTLAFALSAGLRAQDAAQPAPVAPPQTAAPAAPASSVSAPKPRISVAAPANAATSTPKEQQLRLNFRGAPLDMVLNYMSEAAGYTIVLETPVKGSVDVWSNQALTKTEAVELLNSVLNKNGYAAIVNGRTMTIVSKEEAKRRDIPVKSGNNPESIPKNDEIVTQILPVRYINATQVTKDLAPLLPTTTSITANEAGNALVITDTQINIRRVAEIVSALDGAISGVTQIKVYPLKYADAKALAATVKDLLGSTGGSSRDPRSAIASAIASRFGGGGPGGPGGFPGMGGDSGGRSRSGSGGSSGGAAAATFVAVADEYSNSLIVSAPDEKIAAVDELIKTVDQPVEDVSELRVFHLKNADPVEMASLLMELFPDPTASNNRNSSRSGSPGFPGIPGFDPNRTRSGSGGNSNDSDRARKQSKVTAVADARTSSVIVTASKDMMTQISEMVLQLDSSNAKKQKVFVYSLENAEASQVESVLKELFESQNNRSSSTQNRNALDTRANNSAQQQGAQQPGFGTSGLGGGSGGATPR